MADVVVGNPVRSAGRAVGSASAHSLVSRAHFREFGGLFRHPPRSFWGPPGPGGRDSAWRLVLPDRGDGRTERRGKRCRVAVSKPPATRNALGSSAPRMGQVWRLFPNSASPKGQRNPQQLPASCHLVAVPCFSPIFSSRLFFSLFNIPKRNALNLKQSGPH